jgi:hypothetical protein
VIPVHELNFGFSDAENYKRRENKDLFNKIFVRTEALDRLVQSNIFFLLGEKGTGKTAYAVYLSNNTFRDARGKIDYIRETDYQKFITLKSEHHLQLSEYSSIWKVILYLLIAQKVWDDDVESGVLGDRNKFFNLKKAIEEYYKYAFTPEIAYAMNFVQDSKIVAELFAKYLKVGGEQNETISFSESRFQTNLLYLQKQFEDALRSLKLKHTHILFIDGIDIRPASVPYREYLDCIKGLADAVWSINNDFFSGIKDSPGRLRVVLLMRPDIFVSLGLQNQNNKIKDNSVLLDLITTYKEYKYSSLFKIVDRLLSSQQEDEMDLGECWNHYFPWKAINTTTKERDDSSFIPFLRYSLYRPRDFVSMLSSMQKHFDRTTEIVFSEADFERAEFKRDYSNYLVGEVKDHLTFYYTVGEYELFLKFFEFLNGKMNFTYERFTSAYSIMIAYIKRNKLHTPAFFSSPDVFLQFLYELNVISYVEEASDEQFSRWCFRERTYANVAPKVKTQLRYQIHFGMAKTLNLGKPITK